MNLQQITVVYNTYGQTLLAHARQQTQTFRQMTGQKISNACGLVLDTSNNIVSECTCVRKVKVNAELYSASALS